MAWPVTEDEERSFTLATRLRVEGYEPVTTEFASEALELVRSEHFDLYMLNKRFRVESGAYLCQKLFELTPETRLIIFANGPDRTPGQEIARTGVHAQLVEAIDFRELLFSLRHLLSEKKELAQATV